MSTVPMVALGDGLITSALGFGCMSLSGTYGPADDEESEHVLDAAIDAGVRLIDTADVYGAGHNELLVGRTVRRRHHEVELATKFGFAPPGSVDERRFIGDPEYVATAARASLGRLGVDHIDLYYYHRLDPTVPIEDTIGAMAELVRQGLVRHLGVSEVTGDELRRAHAVHPIAAVQSEWSLISRDVEVQVIPTARELGVGFVAYAPLGRGLLANADVDIPDDDLRRAFPRFDDDALPTNQGLARTVAELAARLSVTPSQLALAWVRERARELAIPVTPIPGTRRIDRLGENLASLTVEIPPTVRANLDALAERSRGDRARDVSAISQGRERVGGRP
ncbi:aldo/keto reductase [Microcella alkaliphila]|uniref:Aldo/keto reductase n=1 Tax=Microcella alkaliphila TaxID=279828 RepID=A0A0U5BGH7_9MICO|nr:aldo/keto reductase [Microcella alkaliphila]BAU33343.1 aldo/keto reductase [Microcella alkaliphila]